MIKSRKAIRERKKEAIRKKIYGASEKPRLAIFRSATHIYAQIIDDDKGVTVASASTLDKTFKEKKIYGGNVKAATEIGKMIAEKAKEKQISQVVFDRGGFIYHGRIKALADAARQGGLKF